MIATRFALLPIAVLLAIAASVVGLPAASAAAPCDAAWTPLATPGFDGWSSGLVAPDADGASTWAIARLRRGVSEIGARSVILSSSGGRLIARAVTSAALADLDLANGRGWAVGSRRTETGYAAVVLRGGDTGWTPVSVPSPGEWENALRGVAAAGADRAWAVGVAADLGVQRRPLMLRLSNGAWTETPLGIAAGELNDITSTPANTWAVGSHRAGTLDQGLALRWDGAGWRRTPVPTLRGGLVLTSVSAGIGGQAWAVGYQPAVFDTLGASGNPTSAGAVALRWDGTAWARVALPRLPDGTILSSITTFGRVVLAVGEGIDGNDVTRSVVLRLDGRAHLVTTAGMPPAALNAVAAGSGGFVVGGARATVPAKPFDGTSRTVAGGVCVGSER